ncbi:ras-GEF domain-containing family member 1C-like isoform X1 [Brachionus plicatilis]|uniref:Ras-GEF domain-containing family member 1C-like isoform X1 n=1 Tax=Brachionus plicatilis TaxID=10195 RepID=A0A3M7P1S2_BRAPC|nr:ras-GEF domain-containing family member 1C-like isoform X1 [Brachionus plicatilis]
MTNSVSKLNMNEMEEKPATFDHLTMLLMSSDLILFDKSFVFTFFLSSRVFTSPNDLLIKILEKTFYYMLHHKNLTQTVVKKCISRFIFILNQWIRGFPSDFRDVDVICTLRSIQDKFSSLDDSFGNDFDHLFSFVAKQISNIESFEKNLIHIHQESVKKLNKKLSDLNILDVCDAPSALANQLTCIELERVKNVGAEEFLNFYMTSQSSKIPPSSQSVQISDVCKKNFRVYLNELKQACQTDILIEKTKYTDSSFKRTSNLLAYISWFNRVSWLVCTEIVKISDLEKRVKIVDFFIDTALYCYRVRNYNSLMAIITGLQSYPTSRLKETWNYVDKNKWNKLVYFSDPLNNYRNYRNLFKNNKQKKPDKLIIPAFSIIMKDLNFYFNNISTMTKKNFIGISENMDQPNFPNNAYISNYLLTEPLLREDSCFEKLSTQIKKLV